MDSQNEREKRRLGSLTGKYGLRRLEFIFLITLAAFVVGLLAISFWAGLDGVISSLRRLSPEIVLVMIGLSLFNYGIRALRWQFFSNNLGLDIPWRYNFLYYITGFVMSTTPGKAGEILRLWLIQRCHGFRYERTFPLFIGDRLSDMLATIVLCLAGIGSFAAYAHYAFVVFLGIALLMVIFLRPRLICSLINLLYCLSGRRFPKLFAKMRTACRYIAGLFTLPVLGGSLILACLGWFAEVLAFHLILTGLGAKIDLQNTMFIMAFGAIAGAVSMLPGGLGGTEAAMLALLVLVGIGFEIAIAAVVVIRLGTLWFAVVLGFLAFPFSLRLVQHKTVAS